MTESADPNQEDVKVVQEGDLPNPAGTEDASLVSKLAGFTPEDIQSLKEILLASDSDTEDDDIDVIISSVGADEPTNTLEVDQSFFIEAGQGCNHMQALGAIIAPMNGYVVCALGTGTDYVYGPSINNYALRMSNVEGWKGGAKDSDGKYIATVSDVTKEGKPFSDGGRKFTIRPNGNGRYNPIYTSWNSLIGKLMTLGDDEGVVYYNLDDDFWEVNMTLKYDSDTNQTDLNPKGWMFTGFIGECEMTHEDIQTASALLQIPEVIMVADSKGVLKARMGRVPPSSGAIIAKAVLLKAKIVKACNLQVRPTTTKSGGTKRLQVHGEGNLWAKS